jgi:glycosyltransferase involved in cell wall biosynthesis
LRIDIEVARRMDKKILRNLPDENAALYVLHRGSEHLLRTIAERGGFCVLEQTAAPIRIDRRLVLEEHDTFPDWSAASHPLSDLSWFADMEERGWRLADLIICGSEYVRHGIGECGGPTERCRVVPSGIDSRFSEIKRMRHDGPLRVLTVGAVGLRKGSPYVLAVAKYLQKKAVFRMVGPFHGEVRIRRLLQEHLQLTGQVPRSRVAKEFEWADLFFLPSVSEGSAMVVYEALSAGLPVVCTPNTGSVVRDGYNGYLVPIRDVGRMCERIEAIADDPALLARLSENARSSRSDWSFEGYRQRLVKSLT